MNKNIFYNISFRFEEKQNLLEAIKIAVSMLYSIYADHGSLLTCF